MKKASSSTLDIVGAMASALCAMHCAITPLLLGFTAIGSIAFLTNPHLEIIVLSLTASLALFSLLPSYLKGHRKGHALSLAFLGIFLLGSGHLIGHEWELPSVEVVLAVAGGLLLCLAHLKNLKLLKDN